MNNDARRLIYLRSSPANDSVNSLIQQGGWDVHVATRPENALQIMDDSQFRVGMVHWDASTGDLTSLRRQAEQLIEADHGVNWVALISGMGRKIGEISKVISTYFYDYHTTPVDAERLLMTLGHAYGMAEIRQQSAESEDSSQQRGAMVGNAPCMHELFNRIGKVAAIDLNVLIRGESGTGKELTAQAIHQQSNRNNGPFIAVNCGALPKELIQSELFGHERGAFTGADRRRVGRIEAAQNGTLFLDEIGDLPLDLQINLLRFLQEKTIGRVGGSTEIPVDVRVIAATHVNLEKAVRDGQFREDLYYRLNVLHIDMPPLREREGDVEELAEHFLKTFSNSMRPDVKGFSKQAITAIKDHSWPGNVREMSNRIQRAVVMCEGRLVKPRDLGLDQEPLGISFMTLAQAREKAEKEVIEATLSAVRNNVSKAARRLDISRVTLYRLLEAHDIDWQRTKNAQ